MFTQAVTHKMLVGKTALMWDHCFFATMFLQLDVQDMTGMGLPYKTMATDGKRLLVDPDFVESLTNDELIFALCHEVMHVANKTNIRRQHRNPKRWNRATDYVINADLIEMKVGKMRADWLHDPRFAGMSAEEVYRILEEEDPEGSAAGDGDPGGCGAVMDACDPSDQNAVAEAEAVIDMHIKQAAAIAKKAGTLSAAMKKLLDRLTAPKVDWRAMLRRYIDACNVSDYSWQRPNRRFLHQNLILPGTVEDGVSLLTVLFDTSGSVFDAKILTAFASEINGAFGDGCVKRINVVYIDTQVKRVEEFEAGDDLDMKPEGGGGTVFGPGFDWIEENAADSAAVLVFTDMYIFDLTTIKDPGCPVLWCIHGDSRSYDGLAAQAPFGECVYLPPTE